MKWAGYITHIGGIRNAYEILVGKPEGKKPLEDLGAEGRIILERISREIGWECMDWMLLAQDRDQWWSLVNMHMNHWVP